MSRWSRAEADYKRTCIVFRDDEAQARLLALKPDQLTFTQQGGCVMEGARGAGREHA